MAIAVPRDDTPVWRTQPVPVTGASGGTSTGFSTLGEWETWFYSLTRDKGLAPTLETLQSLQPELEKVGGSLVMNARGTSADLMLPGIGIVDPVGSMDNPDVGQRTWQFLVTGEGAPGATGSRPRGDAPTIGQAIPRDDLFRTLTAQGIAAAQAAARRQRARAGAGGRQSTILGGMPAKGSTGPKTRPAGSLVGGY